MLQPTDCDDAGLSTEAEVVKKPRQKIIFGIVIFSLLMGNFLYALDNTIVADIQPQIVRQFDAIDKLSWVPNAYVLSGTVFVLLWSKLYIIVSEKWLFILTVALFEIGSALCGAAISMNMLIAGRAIAGAGGTGIYFGVMSLITSNTSPSERPIYFALTGWAWGAGTVLGPIVGGSFAGSAATWRWAFYINLVIGAPIIPIYVFLIKDTGLKKQGLSLNRLLEVDWLGWGLQSGALVMFLTAMTLGGITYSWHNGILIALFIMALVFSCLFCVFQWCSVYVVPEQRIFPVLFLRSSQQVTLFVLTACASAGVFVPIYYLPLYFQLTMGDTAIMAGVRLLPLVFMLVASCLLSGYALSNFKSIPVFGYYITGTTLVLIGGILLARVNTSSSTAEIYVYSVLLGFGTGFYQQTSFSVSQDLAQSSPQIQSLSVAFIMLAQELGVLMALGISYSIFLNQSMEGLSAALPDLSRIVVERIAMGEGLDDLSQSDKERAIVVLVTVISNVYNLVTAAGGIGLFSALLYWSISHHHQKTDRLTPTFPVEREEEDNDG